MTSDLELLDLLDTLDLAKVSLTAESTSSLQPGEVRWITHNGRRFPIVGIPDKIKSVKKVSGRAYTDEARAEKVVISKHQTKQLGEQIIAAAFKLKSFNTEKSNDATDAIDIANGELAEIKTTRANVGKDNMKFRVRPGYKGSGEKKYRDKLSPKKRHEYDVKRIKDALARKNAMLGALSKRYGKTFKAVTYCVIVDPVRKKADVFKVPGFHDTIRGPKLFDNYVGTYAY